MLMRCWWRQHDDDDDDDDADDDNDNDDNDNDDNTIWLSSLSSSIYSPS
jgi:hypothetical protein